MTFRSIGNILVTGGAGFIGSAFIRYLLDEKISFNDLCINLDLMTYAGNLDNLSSIMDDPRYHFQQGDICDQAIVDQLCQHYNIKTIIHFAAESHVDRSILSPHQFVQTNVMGTFHLLEVIRKRPYIHFHHVSTDEVYGSLDNGGFFTEETPYHPNSPYSASKAASDHFARAYAHTYGLSACISNCSNNYGPCQFPEKLIPLMILNCLNEKALPIYGKGLNVRDWLFVEDHAEALYLLLQRGESGKTYNIGGDAEMSNIDVVKAIIKVISELGFKNETDLNALITYVKDRPGHDLRYAVDFSRLKQELGWMPRHKFEEGLKETILWYAQNKEWVSKVQSGEYQQWLAHQYK